jgi:hypothetical protein
MFPLKVEITPEIIRDVVSRRDAGSDYQASCHCLVAEAMNRAVKPASATCGITTATVSSPSSYAAFDLPLEVTQLIQAFDRRAETQEASFDLIPREIHFPVTQEHIDLACSRRDQEENFDCIRDCVVGTAAQASFPGVEVRCGFTTLKMNGIDYRLSEETTKNIYAFMDREPVSPFDAVASLVKS